MALVYQRDYSKAVRRPFPHKSGPIREWWQLGQGSSLLLSLSVHLSNVLQNEVENECIAVDSRPLQICVNLPFKSTLALFHHNSPPTLVFTHIYSWQLPHSPPLTDVLSVAGVKTASALMPPPLPLTHFSLPPPRVYAIYLKLSYSVTFTGSLCLALNPEGRCCEVKLQGPDW